MFGTNLAKTEDMLPALHIFVTIFQISEFSCSPTSVSASAPKISHQSGPNFKTLTGNISLRCEYFYFSYFFARQAI